MTGDAAASGVGFLSVPEITKLYREAMRDRGYQEFPLGQEAAAYLRVKRKRLTDASYRDYESSSTSWRGTSPTLSCPTSSRQSVPSG
jgi:hypothetical protein